MYFVKYWTRVRRGNRTKNEKYWSSLLTAAVWQLVTNLLNYCCDCTAQLVILALGLSLLLATAAITLFMTAVRGPIVHRCLPVSGVQAGIANKLH